MESEIQIVIATAAASLLGTLVGGGITYLLNKQSHAQQIAALKEQYKTDFMAEETARHFLNHKGYTDRAFDTQRIVLLHAYAGSASEENRARLDHQRRIFDAVQFLWLAAGQSSKPAPDSAARLNALEERLR